VFPQCHDCPPRLPAKHQEACAETARTMRHNTVKDKSQAADFTQAAKSTPEHDHALLCV